MGVSTGVRKVLVLSKIKGLKQAVTAAVAVDPQVSNAFELCFPKDTSELSLTRPEEEAKAGKASRFEILLGDPNLCATFLREHTGVRWVQSTFAGVEPLIGPMRMPEHAQCMVSRCAALGKDMAQYVAGWVIATERNFLDVKAFNQDRMWNEQTRERFMYRPLDSVTVGVIGLGDIGGKIAEAMSVLGCRVVGFKRTVTETASAHVQLITDDLPAVLAQSDYIVNVLPSTPATHNLLSGPVLEHCQCKSPVLINLGRGNVIDDASLLRALDRRLLSAAILDVFATEPLPPASPLWAHPHVTITPHVGALSHPHVVAATFAANTQRIARGKQPVPLVNAERGY